MSARLHLDHHVYDAPPGASLFACAEAVGVPVPTSCVKQGRCKECVVEVTEGMDLLTPRTPAEAHLGGPYRLACCAHIAGGFGRHLNLDSARRIGLIPDIPAARIRQIGNGSIEGATLALLSRSKRDELEALVRHVVHRRLETHPQFSDAFVDGCQFVPIDPTPLPPAPHET